MRSLSRTGYTVYTADHVTRTLMVMVTRLWSPSFNNDRLDKASLATASVILCYSSSARYVLLYVLPYKGLLWIYQQFTNRQFCKQVLSSMLQDHWHLVVCNTVRGIVILLIPCTEWFSGIHAMQLNLLTYSSPIALDYKYNVVAALWHTT